MTWAYPGSLQPALPQSLLAQLQEGQGEATELVYSKTLDPLGSLELTQVGGVGLQSPAAVQCHGAYRKVSSAYSYSSHGPGFPVL